MGFYECICPRLWNGYNCEAYDEFFNGGLGKPVTTPPTTPASIDKQKQMCIDNNCAEKAGNGQCDEECNLYACKFDNHECTFYLGPWQNCSAIRQGIHCYDLFKNGRCDKACNSKECLYDGFDCVEQVKECNPIYNEYCSSHYGNGHCDKGCDNEACGWDGLDCSSKEPDVARGTLVFILKIDPEEFSKIRVDFLRDVGRLLHTVLRIKQNEGMDMIYPWPDETYPVASELRTKRAADRGTQVFSSMDNQRCQEECFGDTRNAAEFLAAGAQRDGLAKKYKVHSLYSADPPRDPVDSPIWIILSACLFIVIVALLLGVLGTAVRRKRAHGTTWFPEGFRLNLGSSQTVKPEMQARHSPVGEERAIQNGHIPQTLETTSSSDTLAVGWEDESPDHPRTKRFKPDPDQEGDHRQWTREHLEAASIPQPSIAALTPPQGDDQYEGRDVDIRGPGGYTPLHLASCYGRYGTGDDENTDDGSSELVTTLLSQGASINARTDLSGETSLHLAARYARADAARRLLDMGADPNTQDHSGRTPLHAAVAADAQGVFQILLRHRQTNLNMRMNDGTTALHLAARLAIEGAVNDLIGADADVNAVDDYGKTALHWAAAVNDIEAAIVLLQHGANRDAQDAKDETPLFVAAKEGSFEVAKMLLDHFANRDITDQMDRLPRDIAAERMHPDIVKLLDEYRVQSPGMCGYATSPNLMPNYMAPNKTKKQRQRKTNAMKEAEALSPHNQPHRVHLPTVKKTRKKKGAQPQPPPAALGSPPKDELGESITDLPPSYESATGLLAAASGHDMNHHPHPHLISQSLQELQADMANVDELVHNGAWIDTMASHIHPHMLLPVSSPSSISSPPGTGSSTSSPLSHPATSPMVTSEHSPSATGSMGPSPLSNPVHSPHQHQMSPKKSFPLSPTHLQALQHQAAIAQRAQGSPPNFMNSMNQEYNTVNMGMQQQPQMTHLGEQYPTPPSQHSLSDSTPQHMGYFPGEQTLLTPSPESPEGWSSSSPHSAHSGDWSDAVASPPQTRPIPQYHIAPKQLQPQQHGDGVYL